MSFAGGETKRSINSNRAMRKNINKYRDVRFNITFTDDGERERASVMVELRSVLWWALSFLSFTILGSDLNCP